MQWDRKLDARLAMALMSIQAIKGAQFGIGFGRAAGLRCMTKSQMVVTCVTAIMRRYRACRTANTIVGAVMEPIPTLYKPLRGHALMSSGGAVERSDSCAVPAALVVAEGLLGMSLLMRP